MRRSTVQFVWRAVLAIVSVFTLMTMATDRSLASSTDRVTPGALSMILKYQQTTQYSELSYAANATGWVATSQVCVTWDLEYRKTPRDYWDILDSGSHCGKGSAHMSTRYIPCPHSGTYKLTASATGPGGTVITADHLLKERLPCQRRQFSYLSMPPWKPRDGKDGSI